MAGGDEAVAAVVAGAGEHDDFAVSKLAEHKPGLLGDGEAGVLHQLLDRDAAFALGVLHFGDGGKLHVEGPSSSGDKRGAVLPTRPPEVFLNSGGHPLKPPARGSAPCTPV